MHTPPPSLRIPPKQQEMDESPPQNVCSKVVEQLKKSGEFDKYRREIVDKIVKSEDVQILFEQCREIVEKTVASTSDLRRCEIGRMREFVKNELKRRRLVDHSLQTSLPLCLDEIAWKASEKVEEAVRLELGIVKQEIKQEVADANMELIDMEVSSGTGGSSSSDRSACSRPSTPAAQSRSSISSTNVSRKRTGSQSVQSKKDNAIPSGPRTSFLENDTGEGDDSDLLERFADSISSVCTSSLSCNASGESSQAESPMGLETNVKRSTQSSKSERSNSTGESSTKETIDTGEEQKKGTPPSLDK